MHLSILFEPPDPHRAKRKQIASKLLGDNLVDSLRIVPSSEVSLMVFGSGTGVMVDIGLHYTKIQPVYNYAALPHSTVFMPLGGAHVSQVLNTHLRSQGIAVADSVVDRIKKHVVEVRVTPADDEDPDSLSCADDETFTLGSRSYNISARERCLAAEVLFDPLLAGKQTQGLVASVAQAIQLSPIDTRKQLSKNICLVGGTSALRGLRERLQTELAESSPCPVSVNIPVNGTSEEQLCMYQWCSYLGTHIFTRALDSTEHFTSATHFEVDSKDALKQLFPYD